MNAQPELLPASNVDTIEVSYSDALAVMEHQRELGCVITCAEARQHGYRLTVFKPQEATS